MVPKPLSFTSRPQDITSCRHAVVRSHIRVTDGRCCFSWPRRCAQNSRWVSSSLEWVSGAPEPELPRAPSNQCLDYTLIEYTLWNSMSHTRAVQWQISAGWQAQCIVMWLSQSEASDRDGLGHTQREVNATVNESIFKSIICWMHSPLFRSCWWIQIYKTHAGDSRRVYSKCIQENRLITDITTSYSWTALFFKCIHRSWTKAWTFHRKEQIQSSENQPFSLKKISKGR